MLSVYNNFRYKVLIVMLELSVCTKEIVENAYVIYAYLLVYTDFKFLLFLCNIVAIPTES